jgi:hypothetical protein
MLPAIPVLLLLRADTVAWLARRTHPTFAVAAAASCSRWPIDGDRRL